MEAGLPQETVYRLDAEDRIVWVNEAWDDFALENGAPELRRPAILGRRLWDFVVGGEIQLIHRALLERVRGGRHLLDLPFRCDGPALRRFMLMEIWPLAEGGAEYRCRTQRVEARPYIGVLDSSVEHAGRAVKLCAWCRRVALLDNVWVEVEDAVPILGLLQREHPPPVEHTLCPRDRRRLRGLSGGDDSR